MGQADMKSVADVVALDQERQKRADPAESPLNTAGGMLRAAREAMGLDIAAVAEGTNIKPEHLVAIEAMDIASLPSQPYTMGFVRAYARQVALPEIALMERFRVQAGWIVHERATGLGTSRPVRPPREGKELSVLLLFSVIGFALWCAWKLLISNAPVPSGETARFAYTGQDVDDVPVVERPVEVEPTIIDDGAVLGESPAPISDDAEIAIPESLGGASPDSVGQTAAEVEPVVAPVIVEPIEEVITPRLLTRVEPVYPPNCEGNAAPVETVLVSTRLIPVGA
ncbi:MAG: helix-turn-helix domain-containing protein [Pseudomonadota bacterium]